MTDGHVRYAGNGDVRLAYRVLGDGEIPLVLVPGWVSNVDLYDDPAYPFAPAVEQLAPQTRLILWDKRGTGLSDPVTRVPTLDERMDDLHEQSPVFLDVKSRLDVSAAQLAAREAVRIFTRAGEHATKVGHLSAQPPHPSSARTRASSGQVCADGNRLSASISAARAGSPISSKSSAAARNS